MESAAEGLPLEIVCFSDIFWDALWQRHQQLFTRFPSNWRILFIEPTSIPVLLMQPKRLFARKYLNIEIVSLPSIPLIDRFENLRWINDSFVSLWLRFILRKKNMREPVLFYYEPRYSTLIGKLQEKMVILDYIDDKLAFSNVPSWMKIYLDNLIEKANLIFVASSYLHKSILKTRTDDVHLIGNGVDVNHFRKAMTDIPIPEDIAHIKSKLTTQESRVFSLIVEESVDRDHEQNYLATIADYLGISGQCVNQYLRRIRKKITEIMKEGG